MPAFTHPPKQHTKPAIQELKRRDATIDILNWKVDMAGSDLVKERRDHAAQRTAQAAQATEALAAATAEIGVGGWGREPAARLRHAHMRCESIACAPAGGFAGPKRRALPPNSAVGLPTCVNPRSPL